MQQLLFLGLLIGGPPSKTPKFELLTKKSFTEKDAIVAIVCFAPVETQYDFAKIDRDIALYLSHKFKEKQIKVINPDRVNDWIDKHSDWDKAEEIGEAFKAKYVVSIDVNEFTLYEANSANLYRGRSELVVRVIQMDSDGTGEEIFKTDVASMYPLMAPKATSEVSYEQFKRMYLTRLVEEIGRNFYPHYNGDDIPDAI